MLVLCDNYNANHAAVRLCDYVCRCVCLCVHVCGVHMASPSPGPFAIKPVVGCIPLLSMGTPLQQSARSSCSLIRTSAVSHPVLPQQPLPWISLPSPPHRLLRCREITTCNPTAVVALVFDWCAQLGSTFPPPTVSVGSTPTCGAHGKQVAFEEHGKNQQQWTCLDPSQL